MYCTLYCIHIRTGQGIYGQIYPLRLREFLRAKPEGTPECKPLYLTLYPESSPITGIISFLIVCMLMIPSLISLTIILYTPSGVYCQIYPSLEENTVEFNFNIPYLRMIYCILYFLLYCTLTENFTLICTIHRHSRCSESWLTMWGTLPSLSHVHCSERCTLNCNVHCTGNPSK